MFQKQNAVIVAVYELHGRSAKCGIDGGAWYFLVTARNERALAPASTNSHKFAQTSSLVSVVVEVVAALFSSASGLNSHVPSVVFTQPGGGSLTLFIRALLNQ